MTSHPKGVPRSFPEDPRKSLRVLCAEDDQDLAFVLKCALENEGHRVDCAEDGQAAFGRAGADLTLFDLLITDHQMPGLSGLRLVEKLREVGFPGRIVVCSSNLCEEDLRAYRAFAVDRILTKPVQLAQLLEAVLGTDATAP